MFNNYNIYFDLIHALLQPWLIQYFPDIVAIDVSDVACQLRQPGSEDFVAEELWTSSGDTAADRLAPNYWTGTKSFHSRGTLNSRLTGVINVIL